MFFLRALACGTMLLFASCGNFSADSPPPPPKVIVGGTLIDGTGRPPIPDAIVIVELGKVLVATASPGIKIPEKAVRTNATGLYITPSKVGSRLEYGAAADLFLLQGNPLDNPLVLATPMRVMQNGEWLDANRK
jgi:imidazolonepropionase-like amidohydrolase